MSRSPYKVQAPKKREQLWSENWKPAALHQPIQPERKQVSRNGVIRKDRSRTWRTAVLHFSNRDLRSRLSWSKWRNVRNEILYARSKSTIRRVASYSRNSDNGAWLCTRRFHATGSIFFVAKLKRFRICPLEAQPRRRTLRARRCSPFPR